MKCGAGFLTVEFIWMLIQSSDAGPTMQTSATGASCSRLMAVTRSLVAGSLKGFDKANGEHLGTWHPGFPQLEVPLDAPLDGSRVLCSLLFMAQGLQEVLDDQRNDLNPKDTSLHEELAKAVSSVTRLAACMALDLGAQCSQKPLPPTMPGNAFAKKQWSHTLLSTARVYLDWLERKCVVEMLKIKGKKRMGKIITLLILFFPLILSETFEATLQEDSEASGYLL
uniref:uncharacterized protein LOC120830809 n=1 Tax=Gasterosteus aculeatus aculeatus TaxID=481459 RepID=UPI001A9A01DD|nr:uncharacterized protein LOC120830809 [Gasterosteus aculeatus aculeatus]